ncbi:MAG: endolytic transglycosylase MltG [Patescibacteria group bacterium]|mgnify:CR=1 FL=1
MKLLVGLSLLLVIMAFSGFVWWTGQLAPANSADEQTYPFIIPLGQTASQTTSSLFSKSLIRSPLAGNLYLKFSGLDKKIRPGTYFLSPSLHLKPLLESLTAGPRDIWITFPEGWRREQIATRLAANLQNFNSQTFLTLTATLEGRLFPDTYLIPTYATEADLVTMLTSNFSRKVRSLDPDDLILASLVERETRRPSDRPTVAGILKKRLAAGWPLQVDATIQYARGDWSPITNTRIPSVYNTYIHPGLPPTPIANPGLESINAVRNPKSTPYWYYLHDAQGQIHYAATIGEHNSNVDKYLRD